MCYVLVEIRTASQMISQYSEPKNLLVKEGTSLGLSVRAAVTLAGSSHLGDTQCLLKSLSLFVGLFVFSYFQRLIFIGKAL